MTVKELFNQLTPIIMRIGPKNGNIVPLQIIISNRSYALESIKLKDGYLNLDHGKSSLTLQEFYRILNPTVEYLNKQGLSDTIRVVSGPLNKEITKLNYTNNVIQLIV